jgi:hypothetical protein
VRWDDSQRVELFAALSFAATLVAGLTVGGRLLLLARETRRTAELFLGLGVALLVVGGILEVAGLELARIRHDWAYRVEVVALFSHSASASCMSFAVWRVFHPDRPWALRLCLIETALLFTSWQAVILPSQHTYVTGFTFWFHLHVASRGAAFAWGAIAAGLHHRRLRRQLAIGLVDPFLCHRFLLWTIGMGSTAAILATALFTNVTRDELVFANTAALLVVSLLGLIGGPALLFAFVPPAAYVRLVQRAGAPPSAPAQHAP